MIWFVIQAVAGLVALVFAGDVLVRGSANLAERLGVPSLIIGLTVVAFGTSAPELVVAVDAVLKDAPTLALGNVVGSNIANILLVIGLPALITPMACTAPRLTRNVVVMLLVTAIFVALAFSGQIGRWDALALLSLLCVYLMWNIQQARANPDVVRDIEQAEEELGKGISLTQALLLVVAGLTGLVIGADLLVTGSVAIARTLGVSEAIIGLTLVAVGTSLPELVTAIAAAVRSQCDVAVGNILGSNIFNLLAIIGFSALVGPIPVPDSFLTLDLWVMVASSATLLPICKFKIHVGRFIGLLFLLAYGGYMAWLIQSGASMAHMTGQS